VTQKIIQGVKAIAAGTQEKLRLGNLDIWRDWGWAPDYVEAMHRMLLAEEAKDYMIGSGRTHSLRELVERAFELAGLKAAHWTEVSEALMRPTDLTFSATDPGRIAADLGWRSSLGFEEIVQKMYHNTLF
jgi:GDPmannose 4,6-dehydratase